MNLAKTTATALIASAFPVLAMAQNANPDMYERNVYQQQRIEQGLRDGSLTVQEAAALQRGEARISRMESRALSDGTLSDAERRQIAEAQNRQSRAIERERSDNQRGDPNSRSARRMEADVQRNINDQRRIAEGVRSGQITNREAARLQYGESRVLGQEARAGADGHVSRYEQRRIGYAENHQSRAIHHERTDAQQRGSDRQFGQNAQSSQRHWQSRHETGQSAGVTRVASNGSGNGSQHGGHHSGRGRH